MATFTISLASTPFTGSKSWTLSDADVTSLITYLNNRYAPATGAAALVSWAQNFVNRTVAEVQDFQQTQVQVPSITFT